MNYNMILKTSLFSSCTEEDVKNMAKNLKFRTVKYNKDNFIFGEGDVVTDIGLVLSGSVRMEHNDFFGNTSILGIAQSGEVFAEAYACIPNEPLMIDVVANENCEILFISVDNLFKSCTKCNSQNKVIQNLVVISAQKNLQLSRRTLHTSSKTIRGRLMSYFSQQMSTQASNKIVIPFNRQQLADYLNLDRSALSKELGKMKQDGLIDYKKNLFKIL